MVQHWRKQLIALLAVPGATEQLTPGDAPDICWRLQQYQTGQILGWRNTESTKNIIMFTNFVGQDKTKHLFCHSRPYFEYQHALQEKATELKYNQPNPTPNQPFQTA